MRSLSHIRTSAHPRSHRLMAGRQVTHRRRRHVAEYSVVPHRSHADTIMTAEPTTGGR